MICNAPHILHLRSRYFPKGLNILNRDSIIDIPCFVYIIESILHRLAYRRRSMFSNYRQNEVNYVFIYDTCKWRYQLIFSFDLLTLEAMLYELCSVYWTLSSETTWLIIYI